MAVPPRWMNCPRKGTIIAGKFLPFKTLLDSRYDEKVPEAYRFQLPMLLAYLSSKQAEMGMVVDLTKTRRFYDCEELKKNNIHYIKLECQGQGETPTKEQVATFVKVCDSFFERNTNSIIGVHCTHGFNRTGFMIISYLIERLEWSLEAAVHAFTVARPTGIYKQDYIKELVERYGDGSDDITVPPMPDWCEDDDVDVDIDGNGQSEDNGMAENGERRRAKRKRVQPTTQFMEGVSGVDAVCDADKIHELQKKCQKMCNWKKNGFPGCQPVSMDVKNIAKLVQMPYRVSWKADGTRYMMLILARDEIYMFDRDNTVFAVPQFTFPRRKKIEEHVENTLVDGEMVIDKDKDQLTPRFLIYDIITFEGNDIGKSPLEQRLMCVDKELIQPRIRAESEGKLHKSKEPFRVRQKLFLDVLQTRKVLEGIMPTLSHGHDGLIFSPAEEPYTAGQCFSVLKWKPADLNSVDFRLQIAKINKTGELPRTVGYLWVGGMDNPISEMMLTKETKQLNGKIVECMWNPVKCQWVFMRVRDDKSFPNNWKTAEGVCKSIVVPVTQEKLLEYIEKYAHRNTRPSNQQPNHNQQGNSQLKASSSSGTADSLLMPPPKLPHSK